MRTYGQYCPIARGAEIFAERWTPLIIRNLHLGCGNFTEILEGAPGLSRTLLSQRLKQLERLGVVESAPKPDGRGHNYELTSAGHDLFAVCQSLGEWGARWLEIAPENLADILDAGHGMDPSSLLTASSARLEVCVTSRGMRHCAPHPVRPTGSVAGRWP
jgi:DNA-binding HxlR family transcriptional regulator